MKDPDTPPPALPDEPPADPIPERTQPLNAEQDSLANVGRPLDLGAREIILPGFILLKKLGEGGMATVFLARQESLNRLVAVKMLHGSLGNGDDSVTDFSAEARTMALLNHPNILNCYDFVKTPEAFYIIMEYIPGGLTLRELVKRYGALPERLVQRILRDVLDGLAYIDSKECLHCDMKPDNLMIYHEHLQSGKPEDLSLEALFQHVSTRIIICDFGITQHLTKIHKDSETTVGSPMYMSPEQIYGDEPLDCRADMYALAGIAYFLLTGLQPFDCCPRETLLEYKLEHNIPPPRAVNPSVSQAISDVVVRMGRTKRNERFRNYQDLRTALRKTNASGTWFTVAGIRVSNRWKTVAIGIVAALALQGGVLVYQTALMPKLLRSTHSLTGSMIYWQKTDNDSWQLVTDDPQESGSYLQSKNGTLPLVLYQQLIPGMSLDFSLRLKQGGAVRFGLQDSSSQSIVRLQLHYARRAREANLTIFSNGVRQHIHIGDYMEGADGSWLPIRLDLQKRRVTVSVCGDVIGVASLGEPLTTTRFFVKSWKAPVVDVKEVFRNLEF